MQATKNSAQTSLTQKQSQGSQAFLERLLSGEFPPQFAQWLSSRGDFPPRGDIWQCRSHVWLSELGRRDRMLLTSWYREARHTQDSSLQQRIIQSQMSVVLRLRNPVPGQHAFSFIPSREDRIYVPEFPGGGGARWEQFDKSWSLLKRHFLSFVTAAFSLRFPLSPESLLC